MMTELSANLVSSPVQSGFLYIPQDNFYMANLNQPACSPPARYLFSDSATSCIIVIVAGKDRDDNPLVALAHLSRKERFLTFFEIIAARFCGAVHVFAQGANPAFAAASVANSQTLLQWAGEHLKKTDEQPWFVERLSLSVGQGDPQRGNRGCYGIDLAKMCVSNRRFEISSRQRDPSGGVQTLFCIFGLQIKPQLVLFEATQTFTDEQIRRLVDKARHEGWADILSMTKDEVLEAYSSSPQFEAPWFFASLRESALFVKNYRL